MPTADVSVPHYSSARLAEDVNGEEEVEDGEKGEFRLYKDDITIHQSSIFKAVTAMR